MPPLPSDVLELLRDWALVRDGGLVTTRSSWVLPVRRDEEPLILKVARIPDERAGYRLMTWWNGVGAARILASREGALLMERAIGGRDLALMARSGEDDEATRILCETGLRLHVARPDIPRYLHSLDTWFQPLFDLAPGVEALQPAAKIARALLDDPRDVGPLHGDLHHGNVLDFGDRGWLAIDPHGLLGERAFDFANIFTNPDLDDPARPVAVLPERFQARLTLVAQVAGLEPVRLIRWIAAWTGLSAAWFMADGDDQEASIDLTVNAMALRLLG